MKCLVLSGGSGNRLWPLSRKNHPKQFMEIRNGRSMFQETILRNIPFCEEFIILTNKKYESIVKGQLQDFQDLNYSILMEESPLKTAPSIVTLALNSDADEEFLIVSTDNVIDGEYNSFITRLKESVKMNRIAALVSYPKNRPSGHHYFEESGGKVKYVTVWGKNTFLDCGVIGTKVSVLLDSIEPSFMEQCKHIAIADNMFLESPEEFVFHTALADVLKTDKFDLIKTNLICNRITDINSYYDLFGNADLSANNVISNKCKGVKVINNANGRLVVANGLKDILIANTNDAIYITRSDVKNEVKEIANEYYDSNKHFFDDSPIYYHDWGISETLSLADDFKVSKITLYSKNTLSLTDEKGVQVNYFINDGMVLFNTKGCENVAYKSNENIVIKGGVAYSITNTSKTSINLIKIENEKSIISKLSERQTDECFVRLKPALKDYIWGGTKIKDVLGKNIGKLKTVAESWELSAHPAGQSKIATGSFKGETLENYINNVGKQNLGWKAQDYEKFPILIKFIDAREDLSIQVHPNDEYAFPHEGEYGKNEMWYIMGAEKNSCIYMGFNKDISPEEIRERIANNTIMEVMNRIPVKKGETFFLKAGVVHAIGAGCMICEIQQSSNITYRFYDYNRLGKNGKPRELHIEQALEVAILKKYTELNGSLYGALDFPGYKKQLLGQCKYFTATKYIVSDELSIVANGASFRAVVVIDGEGKISNEHSIYSTSKGDTWFFGCKELINIKGKITVIVTSI